MSVTGTDSREEKAESGCEGMEVDAEDINDPARMVSKLQEMGNETMVQQTIKRQNAMCEVFLAWVEDNYGINVGFVCFGFLWFFFFAKMSIFCWEEKFFCVSEKIG